MVKEVKLVAETLNEWKESPKEDKERLNEEQLNEGAKERLAKFVENPDKKKLLVAAFARHIGKTKGLKDALLKLSDESQVKLAKQAYDALEEDPKKGYPWVKIRDGKIVGAGALGVKSKEGLVGSVGDQ